jgi:hypothetical protein
MYRSGAPGRRPRDALVIAMCDQDSRFSSGPFDKQKKLS